MIAVTGKSLSEIVKDIEDQYGETHMEERSYRFTAEEKATYTESAVRRAETAGTAI